MEWWVRAIGAAAVAGVLAALLWMLVFGGTLTDAASPAVTAAGVAVVVVYLDHRT
ncbi:MAG: hypothetical protein ABEJ76_04915 [Halanaeroarchaeum sp.]